MPLQPDPLVQWQFVEVSATPKDRWLWKKVPASDAPETVSAEFADYGLAVCDALRHGFRPKRHYWSTITRHGTTHYSPCGDPVAVPNSAEPGGFLPPAPREAETRPAHAQAK